MERKEIINRVSRMNTKQDLLDLLNDLKVDDLGPDARRFSMRQINYYCNPNRDQHRYTHFDIPKKSGKEPRHIAAPVPGLKSLLVYLNVMFQAMYEPVDCVFGFVPGRSVTGNARLHVGKHYVFNIDLKDFFPSVAQARVWKRLQCPPFNFCDNEARGWHRRVLADVIAGLCCIKIDDNTSVLPQGAPTSPVLTNIICERLDRRLQGLARRFGVTYSRYADDITFSSSHNVFHKHGAFVKEMRRIIIDQHFTLNEAKTRLSSPNQRQEVTGITVNVKPNVTRRYVDNLRHILHRWEKDGYDAAAADFYPHYKSEKGHVKKGNPALENVVAGKLEYLKMVKGENDSTYLRLRNRFAALLASNPCQDWDDTTLSNKLLALVSSNFDLNTLK